MIFIKAYRESVSKRGTFFYAVKIGDRTLIMSCQFFLKRLIIRPEKDNKRKSRRAQRLFHLLFLELFSKIVYSFAGDEVAESGQYSF